MDRASAITFLTNEYAELATDAKLTTDQIATAYGSAVDMSLRQLGTAEADLATATVDQPNIISFLALLHYYALKRFLRVLSIRFDVNIAASLDAKRSQAFAQVKQLLQEAEIEVINLGFNVGGVVAFQMGEVQLDFLEPSLPSEYYINEGTLF